MFNWFNDVLQFLVDLLLWIPRKIWGLLLDGLSAVIAAIPMPAWVGEMAGAASAIPASVTWWLDLIRRLPVVG